MNAGDVKNTQFDGLRVGRENCEVDTRAGVTPGATRTHGPGLAGLDVLG